MTALLLYQVGMTLSWIDYTQYQDMHYTFLGVISGQTTDIILTKAELRWLLHHSWGVFITEDSVGDDWIFVMNPQNV